MEISNKTIGALAVVLVVGMGLHQCCLRRGRNRAETPALAEPQESRALERAAGMVSGGETGLPSGKRAPAPEPQEEPVVVSDPHDSPVVQQRLVDQQVRQMKRYAEEAGGEDPFALSREQIEEFRKRGDPYLW